MKRRALSILLVLLSIIGAGTVCLAAKSSTSCTVISISGKTVTLDCGTEANSFKPGDTVKVKNTGSGAAKKAIEGC